MDYEQDEAERGAAVGSDKELEGLSLFAKPGSTQPVESRKPMGAKYWSSSPEIAPEPVGPSIPRAVWRRLAGRH